MTTRKKKGIGLIVTGVVSCIVGGVFLVFTATPVWVITGISVVSAVCNVLGLTFVAPDTKE